MLAINPPASPLLKKCLRTTLDWNDRVMRWRNFTLPGCALDLRGLTTELATFADNIWKADVATSRTTAVLVIVLKEKEIRAVSGESLIVLSSSRPRIRLALKLPLWPKNYLCAFW